MNDRAIATAPARPTREAAAPLLEARDIVAGYGQGQVLHGATLRVDAGETLALLGRNGSGRSTLLKAIMRLVPGRGSVKMNGVELGKARPHEVARAGIGYVPEERAIFPDLTVRENLVVGLPVRKRHMNGASAAPRWSEEEFFERFPNLKRRANVAGQALSGGEQQMLTICRTLMGEPDVILVDEPTEGLSLAMVDEIAGLLREVARRDIAIVLVEQKLTIALDLCDRVNVMGHGRIVFDDTTQAFQTHPSVRAEWLEV